MPEQTLTEYASAVTAVNSSIDIQTELAQRNASIEDDKKVQIRIGVIIGDVIEDRGRSFGDGVNLAARLEADAPEGGICIPASVFELVRGKVGVNFVDAGDQQFKNIERPVRVYRWGLMVELPHTESNHRASEMPSVAVLALSNLNHDFELDFIGDGITEDLITALSKIRSFKVISRESTFTYKNTSVDIRQIAKELGVGFVLEGGVRKTGQHVWAERYDREMVDIFDLQDEIVCVIASGLEPELNAFERERAVNKSPENLDAWELYQRGLYHMWSYESEGVIKAMQLLKEENIADPKFAPAQLQESHEAGKWHSSVMTRTLFPITE
jgi:adenylate cyclase